MRRYIRSKIPGGTWFFTVNLARRDLRLLTDHAALLREAFRSVNADHPFRTDAIVVLPEHLHAIWTPPEGDTDYSIRWSLIKSRFSRAIERGETVSASRQRRRERGIWQRRFYEHAIRDHADFRRHVDYIHFNPVKHGWAERPSDWPHSSIHRFVKLGMLNADWGTPASTPPLMQR